MNWKQHLYMTLLIGIIITMYFQFPLSLDSLGWLILLGLGSILPDVDLKQSRASGLVFGLLTLSIIFASWKLFGETAEAFIAFLAGMIILFLAGKFLRPSHRTITHSIWFVILSALPIYILWGQFLATGIAFGMIAHIMEDRLSDILRIKQ